MLTPKNLIFTLLRSLADQFEGMSFLYGFDDFLDQHLIEVNPLDSYKGDLYLIREVKAIKTFLENFPDHSILFVSNDEYIKVSKPIFFLKKDTVKYFSHVDRYDATMNTQFFSNEMFSEISISMVLDNVSFDRVVHSQPKFSVVKEENFNDFTFDSQYAMAA